MVTFCAAQANRFAVLEPQLMRWSKRGGRGGLGFYFT